MDMIKGWHHLHKRKRMYENYEPYPHPDRLKRSMDKFIYFIGVLGPIMALPQLIEIWVYGNSAGVSALSWGAFGVIAFFWCVYGVLHRNRPIIISQVLWMLFDVLIVIGIFTV